MNFYEQNKLIHLKTLLVEMSEYHSAQSLFAKKLSKVYGKELNRNFANRVLKGEITFGKELFFYINDAVLIAENIIKSFKEKVKKQKEFIPLKTLINEKASINFLEEQIDITDSLYEKGYMVDASKLIYSLDNIVEVEKISKYSPYLFGMFHMAYSKVQMQLGVTTGEKNSMDLVKRSINVFLKLDEPDKLIRSYSLQGHIFRQLEDYDAALFRFTQNRELVLSSKISEKAKHQFLINTDHQVALTLMNKAHKQKKGYLFESARKIFRETNEKLENSENMIFSKLSKIREAELYVKSGNIKSADNILGDFEDYCEIGVLQPPQRAIFFRVNTEKYAKIMDVKNCLKNFKAGISIAFNEGYKHEQKQFQELVLKYNIIKNNLPENFSVYNPTWV